MGGTEWLAAAEPVTFVPPVVYGTQLPGPREPALKLGRGLKRRMGGAFPLHLKAPGGGPKPSRTREIGRAGQQEWRDRYRMTASA